MTVSYLRTIDLAQAGAISVQQVRNYEASGFIPPAERSPAGYRLYTQRHLVALKTARGLLGGYGWQRARSIMQAVHQGSLSLALALIDERHAELAGTRVQLEQTLAALSTLAEQSAPLAGARYAQQLRVGEAARQVGVRVSALHFWEQQGLLRPRRDKRSRYRLYDEQQMRRLRVVVLLRDAGYNFDAIRTTLDELAAGRPEKAIAAVEKRRAELARMSWACLLGVSVFQAYVGEYWAELSAAFQPEPRVG
jgi:DNA-binding transcriptional MerR regulator